MEETPGEQHVHYPLPDHVRSVDGGHAAQGEEEAHGGDGAEEEDGWWGKKVMLCRNATTPLPCVEQGVPGQPHAPPDQGDEREGDGHGQVQDQGENGEREGDGHGQVQDLGECGEREGGEPVLVARDGVEEQHGGAVDDQQVQVRAGPDKVHY